MALEHVKVGALPFERFEEVLSADAYAEFREAAERSRELFDGRVVWNVNSTSRGGGVAEMLVSLLAYAHGAGVDARWSVIAGNDPFFALTKRIHNNLHSAAGRRRRAGRCRARDLRRRAGAQHRGLLRRGGAQGRGDRARPPAGRV